MKCLSSALTVSVILCLSWHVAAQNNAPLTQKFPSSHATFYAYCRECPDAVNQHVVEKASLIAFGPDLLFEKLHPENTVNIAYELLQYVQYLTITGNMMENGKSVLDDIQEFVAQTGYDEEDLYLHWSEPTVIENADARLVFDGEKTILTFTNGETHEIVTTRAMSIIWTDFYFVFDWRSTVWKEFLVFRAEKMLADRGGFAYDGYYLDLYGAPMVDVYGGIVSGGRIIEWDNLTPDEIWDNLFDAVAQKEGLAYLNEAFPGSVFAPGIGTWSQDWAVDIMEAGDGCFTEMLNFPGGLGWEESWETAKRMADGGRYYSLYSYWDKLPDDFPTGIYDSAKGRTHLHNAGWYWMAYEPGYVLFSVNNHCCEVPEYWPPVMEANIGTPIGPPTIVDQGFIQNGDWYWNLWKREYTLATVYFRGNMAWQGHEGHVNQASIGMGENTAVEFAVPEGDMEFLKADGTWAAAPSTITHMDAFAFVLRTAEQAELSGDDPIAQSDDDGCGCQTVGQSNLRDSKIPWSTLLF